MTIPSRSATWGEYIDPYDGTEHNMISVNGNLKVQEDLPVINLSGELDEAQSDVELIPAPGVGKRIVVRYGSIRTAAATGKCFFEGTVNGAQHLMGMVYVVKFSSFAGIGVVVPLDENTNLRITTTTGSSDTFYYLIYTIEDVRD